MITTLLMPRPRELRGQSSLTRVSSSNDGGAPARPHENGAEHDEKGGNSPQWTLDRRFGVGEAPGHEDRAQWGTVAQVETVTGQNVVERKFRRAHRPQRPFERKRIFRWPVFISSCLHIRGVWKRGIVGIN